MYQTISFSRLSEMAPFANKFRLERVIVDAAKSLDVQVGIYVMIYFLKISSGLYVTFVTHILTCLLVTK